MEIAFIIICLYYCLLFLAFIIYYNRGVEENYSDSEGLIELLRLDSESTEVRVWKSRLELVLGTSLCVLESWL